MRLALIICTKDRPREIRLILESIEKQTRKADHIIIVDGSDRPVEHVVETFYERLPIDYVTVRPPSLPKQRNVGISRLPSDIQWVGFLDDDLILNEDNIEQILACINRHEDSNIGGVGLALESDPEIPNSWARRFFLLDEPSGGQFTRSGVSTAFRKGQGDQEVEWLSGGTAFWKKEVLDTFKFDEWFEGIGYLEDVEFSYRASRCYKLYRCNQASCFHDSHQVPKEKLRALGVWQLTSWWYFVRKAQSFSLIFVFWSMFWIFVNNFVMGILRPQGHRWRKAIGNAQGFFYILTGRGKRRWAFYK